MEKKTRKPSAKKKATVKKPRIPRKVAAKPVTEFENIVVEEPSQPVISATTAASSSPDLLRNVARAAGKTVGRFSRLVKKIKRNP